MIDAVLQHQAPQQTQHKPSLDEALLAIDRALYGYAKERAVLPADLARVLRRGLVTPLASLLQVDPRDDGHLLLGMYPGSRRVIKAKGIELRVPASGVAGLSPNSVTVVHRVDERTVKVCHDVRFGQPSALRKAAEELELPPRLGVDAVETALRALGVLVRPRAVLAAIYFADYRGWDLYRFMQVVPRVHDSDRHLGLLRARELEPDSDYGDMVGVSLPSQDWLSPLLCWAAGAG